VQVAGGGGAALANQPVTGMHVAGAKHRVRFRVSGIGPVQLEAKAWAITAAEPPGWQVSATATQVFSNGYSGARAGATGMLPNKSYASFDDLSICVP
jgi:hypothetical protein